MTQEDILDLAKLAGWDCKFTRIPSETEFSSVPLEMEKIQKFVDLVEATILAREGFLRSR